MPLRASSRWDASECPKMWRVRSYFSRARHRLTRRVRRSWSTAATPSACSFNGQESMKLDRAREIAGRVEHFVRTEVAGYERDPRVGAHGPSADLVDEMRAKARAAGVLTPHVLPDGTHLTHRETAIVL